MDDTRAVLPPHACRPSTTRVPSNQRTRAVQPAHACRPVTMWLS